MKIKSISIENFRSIKNATINFNEITALVGENNAGKTAILRALNSVFNYEYENEFFLNSMHRYWKKTITKITIIFEEVPEKEIYMNKKKDGILRLRFQYSYSKSRNGRTLCCLIDNEKVNVDENFILELKKDIDFVYIPANRGGKDLTWSESSILARVVKAYLQDYTRNRDLLSNQVARMAKSIHKQVLTKLESELSQLNMVDDFGNYKLSFRESIDYKIFLDQINLYLDDEESMPVSEYGSGVKSLTVIALHRMLAKLNNVSIILGIEEPETNLHPQAQKKFIASLKDKRQDCETQAIFATHSTVIVDALDHQDIVLVRREKDEKRGFHSSTSQLPVDFWTLHNIAELKHYNFFKYRNSDFFFAKYVVITGKHYRCTSDRTTY